MQRGLQQDRDRIEGALGLPLPFDNETLDFLLRVATAAPPQEFREMLAEYCPRWPPDKQTSLIRELVDASQAALEGQAFLGNSSSSTAGARFGGRGGGGGAADAMERDRLLAKMLQDEEDAEHTLAKAQSTSARKGRKAGKKDFKPMNINFAVAAGQTPASLGTSAPSSLADMLRNRRSQDQHPPDLSSQHFGPAVSRGGPSPFAGATTNSFADVLRNGRGQDQRHTDQADRPVPQSGAPPSAGFAAGSPSSSAEKLRNRSNLADRQSDLSSYQTGPPVAARVAPPTPPVPSPPPTSAPKSSKRDALIRNAFQAFDVNADSLLDKKELRAFANATGFSGTEEEWHDEFRALCRDHRGLDLASFTELVNDHSEEGCFCEDHELAAMASSMATKKVDARSELIAKAFRVCDANGDGKLDMRELRTFATFTGFDGEDEEWREEYALLCRERQAVDGIDLTAFTEMVNDDSDNGCYCSNAELETIIKKVSDQPAQSPQVAARPANTAPISEFASQSPPPGLSPSDVDERSLPQKPPPVAATQVKNQQSPLQAQQAAVPPQAAPPPAVSKESSARRDVLIRAAFKAFDLDGDGLLDKKELRAFATETGFSGNDEEWRQEFLALCPHGRGLKLLEFTRLVNDESDDGCYCTDKELGTMVTKASGTRGQLISKIFELCDVNGDGKLDALEFRTFLLCQERRASDGIDLTTFISMLNDESQDGCFCADHELDAIVRKLDHQASAPHPGRTLPSAGVPSRGPPGLVESDGDADEIVGTFPIPPVTVASAQLPAPEARNQPAPLEARKQEAISQAPVPPPPAPPPAVSKESSSARRDVLISAAFKAYDVDADGLLNRQELRAFGTDTGFSGDDEDWHQEFLALCPHGRGLDLPSFTRLVNDQSDDGCYCSDDDLGNMVIGAGARGQLIARVFDLCDANRDGKLDMQELRTFAAETGFEGGDEEWRQEYQLLCQEQRDLDGIDLTAFVAMVNDESDNGCFCQDNELDAIVRKLAKPAEEPLPNTSPPVGAAQPLSRQELARAVFRACDADNDGYLSKTEMHSFAQHIGFDGSLQDWGNEYEGLCADHGCSSHVGVDMPLFLRLIDDESDAGCYCQDSELREMLKTLVPKVAASRMGSAQR